MLESQKLFYINYCIRGYFRVTKNVHGLKVDFFGADIFAKIQFPEMLYYKHACDKSFRLKARGNHVIKLEIGDALKIVINLLLQMYDN